MQIVFQETKLPEDENFREGLATLLHSFGYEIMWLSKSELALIDLRSIADPMDYETPFDKSLFYQKPKWYQWRLRRKYRKLLETK